VFLVRCVLAFWCVWVGVVSVLQAEACMYVCIGFKTLFYAVRHLDSTASYLSTGLHLGFFHSWPSLYLPSSFSSVIIIQHTFCDVPFMTYRLLHFSAPMRIVSKNHRTTAARVTTEFNIYLEECFHRNSAKRAS